MADQKTWTSAEIDQLREAFETGKSRSEIARLLNRSVGSIRAKILSLGLRRGIRPWSGTEIELLRKLHGDGLPIAMIGRRLARSVDAVTTMCHRLELRRVSAALPWTAEEVELLKKLLAEGHSLERIAGIIRHPRSSIADKLRQLGLTSSRFRQPWTAEELRTMDGMHAAGATPAQIAERLSGRSAHAVRLKLEKRLRQHGAAAVPAVVPIIRVVHDEPHMPATIPASVEEMERWLRSRDYMVLHRPDGWVIDRHHLQDEDALIAFINERRRRLGLPVFTKCAGTVPNFAAQRPAAPTGWRGWGAMRHRASA